MSVCMRQLDSVIVYNKFNFFSYLADTTKGTKLLIPILVPIFIFFICSICMVIIMCVCCVKIRKRHHRNFNYVALCNEVANDVDNDVIEEPPPEYQEELPALIPDADPPNYEEQLREHNVYVIPRPPLPPP